MTGVTWMPNSGKYRARLRTANGRIIHLGTFRTAEEAREMIRQAREATKTPPEQRLLDHDVFGHRRQLKPPERATIKRIPLLVCSFHGIKSGCGPKAGDLPMRAVQNPGIAGRNVWGGSTKGTQWTAVVDIEDAWKVNLVRGSDRAPTPWRCRAHGAWFARWIPETHTVYAYGDHHSAGVTLHRLIMGLEPGEPRDAVALDGDHLNCRRANLTVYTSSEAGQMRRDIMRDREQKYREIFVGDEIRTAQRRAAHKSRYLGVTYRLTDGKYIARFGIVGPDGRRATKYVGTYDSEVEAAEARREAMAVYRSVREGQISPESEGLERDEDIDTQGE